MMTIIPTRRSWLTSSRLALVVLLVSLVSGAMLLLTGAETTLAICMASAQ